MMEEEPYFKPIPGADQPSRRDLARQRKLEQLPRGFLKEQYLPQRLDGSAVLVEWGGVWRADNRSLRAETQGIFYRGSKCLEDTVDKVLPWNSTVHADDEGDGWVKVNAARH
ncbi:unnamed protein product [Symbiodinium natans]|uniref:Uncharacterized protein n=1 Tax=Symbiodinium natans TaxID=878477 RepID=A0A812PF13_9DINO|nr:unnamed protein product [Symbiodinium natans]